MGKQKKNMPCLPMGLSILLVKNIQILQIVGKIYKVDKETTAKLSNMSFWYFFNPLCIDTLTQLPQ